MKDVSEPKAIKKGPTSSRTGTAKDIKLTQQSCSPSCSIIFSAVCRKKTHCHSLTEESWARTGDLILNFRDITLLAVILVKFPCWFYYFLNIWQILFSTHFRGTSISSFSKDKIKQHSHILFSLGSTTQPHVCTHTGCHIHAQQGKGPTLPQ